MRNLFVLIAIAALAFALSACTPQATHDVSGAKVESNPPKTEQFVKKVDAVKPGTFMPVVRENLGNPDERRHGFVQADPKPGVATETLIKFAPAGTRYEEWVYKRGDSHYHVFFTRNPHGDLIDWVVITVVSTPKDAVE